MTPDTDGKGDRLLEDGLVPGLVIQIGSTGLELGPGLEMKLGSKGLELELCEADEGMELDLDFAPSKDFAPYATRITKSKTGTTKGK